MNHGFFFRLKKHPLQLPPMDEQGEAPLGESSSESSSDESSSSDSEAAAHETKAFPHVVERGEPMMAGLHRRMWHFLYFQENWRYQVLQQESVLEQFRMISCAQDGQLRVYESR